MADILFLNNASSLLDLSINASVLTIQVASGDGDKFPSPSGDQYFVACLENDNGDIEYVKIESRASNVLTVEVGGRGFDNTTAQSFTQNVTRVELRLCAIVIDEFLQAAGDTMTGNLDMGTNEIQNAELTGSTVITGGQAVLMPLRGALGQTTNELSVPASGRATAGGADIVVDSDDIIALLDTAGVIDFNSATVRVIVGLGTGAVLRVSSNAGAEFLDLSCDGTDILAAMTGITELKFTGADIDIGGKNIGMADGELNSPHIGDFSVARQAVASINTTIIDYSLGQYVELAMTQTITDLSIIEPPVTARFGTLTIKLTQDVTGGWVVTNWPSGIKWPKGGVPVLSTTANAVDFVTLWTDDGGTTWYGDFSLDYLV